MKYIVAVHKDGKAQSAMTEEEFTAASKKGWVPLFTEHWDNQTDSK